MSEDTRKYWRLVEWRYKSIMNAALEKYCWSYGAGKNQWQLWVRYELELPIEPPDQIELNALILANALDWSGLSKKTCKALRGLGVNILEEVKP